MINYTWTISGITAKDFNGSPKAIRNVDVTIVAEDGNNKAVHKTKLILEDPTSTAFTAYEDLTEDIVMSWVKNGLQDHVEGLLATQLQAKASEPEVTTALPWV